MGPLGRGPNPRPRARHRDGTGEAPWWGVAIVWGAKVILGVDDPAIEVNLDGPASRLVWLPAGLYIDSAEFLLEVLERFLGVGGNVDEIHVIW